MSSQDLSSDTWMYYLNLWLELNSRFVFWLRKASFISIWVLHASSTAGQAQKMSHCKTAPKQSLAKLWSPHNASSATKLLGLCSLLRKLYWQRLEGSGIWYGSRPHRQIGLKFIIFFLKEKWEQVLLKSALTVVWGPKCFHLSAAKLDMHHWPNWLWETYCK